MTKRSMIVALVAFFVLLAGVVSGQYVPLPSVPGMNGPTARMEIEKRVAQTPSAVGIVPALLPGTQFAGIQLSGNAIGAGQCWGTLDDIITGGITCGGSPINAAPPQSADWNAQGHGITHVGKLNWIFHQVADLPAPGVSQQLRVVTDTNGNPGSCVSGQQRVTAIAFYDPVNAAWICNAPAGSVTPTATPTPTVTATATFTVTPTPTATPTASPTPAIQVLTPADKVMLLTNSAVSFPSRTIASTGNTLIVGFKTCGNAANIADDQAGAWDEVVVAATNSGSSFHIFYSPGRNAGEHVVTTVTPVFSGSSCYYGGYQIEASGLTAGLFNADGGGSVWQAETSVNSGLTPNNDAPNEMLYVGFGEVEDDTATIGVPTLAGGTEFAPIVFSPPEASVTGIRMFAAAKVVKGAGPYNLNWAFSKSAQASGASAMFHRAAAPTPTATPTPTPTATPTPSVSCPAGYTCATPITAPSWTGGGAMTQYGAGLQPSMPALKANPIHYTCVGGGTDNTSGLNAAMTTAKNNGTDVLINNYSGTCQISGTVSVPSNVMLQCTNINTVLYSPVTAAQGPSMIFFNNTTGSGVSNCTLLGTNKANNPTDPACPSSCGACSTSCGPGTATSFLIHGDHASNSNVIGNIIRQTIAQCAYEDYCGGAGPSGCTGNKTNYNSFYDSALYGVCYDNAANSDVQHNYAFNSLIGHEMDNAPASGKVNQVESGLTQYNYSTRNAFGTGVDWVESQRTDGYFEGIFAAVKGDGSGVTASFNVVDGTVNHYHTHMGHANGYNGVDGQYSNNLCLNGATGC